MSQGNNRDTKRTAGRTAPIGGRRHLVLFDLAVAGFTFAAILLTLIAVYHLLSPESSFSAIATPLLGVGVLGVVVVLVLRREAARKSRATKKLRDSEKLFFKEVERNINSKVKRRAR